MPVTELINDGCNFAGVDQTADILHRAIKARQPNGRGLFLFRVVWTSPNQILATVEALQAKHPELVVEVLDPHTFFRLFKERATRR